MSDQLAELPYPPLELRRLVGPTDTAAFDNPTRALLFPSIDRPAEQLYASVFDFGCGCGRLARRLIQQIPPPRRYIGIDQQWPLVKWCRKHLQPQAPQCSFVHHDIRHATLNPGGRAAMAPFPVPDHDVSLFIAWSVFTHLVQDEAEFYLRELARVLQPDGVAVTTWFLFDKAGFPMMQEFQHALFINDVDPRNAVIFDRQWLLAQLAQNGLVLTRAVPPSIRGFQWELQFERQADGRVSIELPEDTGRRGVNRPPHGDTAPGEVRFDD